MYVLYIYRVVFYFSNLYLVIKLAYERTLTEADIWEVPHELSVERYSKQIGNAWKLECASCGSKRPSLIKVIFRVFKREFYIGTAYAMLFTILQVLQPIFISNLLLYLSTGEGGFSAGIKWALSLGIVAFFSSFSLISGFYNNRRLGAFVRTAIMMNVYEHALQLSTVSRMKNDIGTTTNLMSIDSEKLNVAILFIQYLWYVILYIIVRYFY